jgi:putative ABC transport system permease protein
MNFLSVFLIAARRLWSNKGLTICSIIGLITAVALISSIPLYTDTANFKVLREQLSNEQGDNKNPRPPFAFMYRYIGAWHGAVETEDFNPVDEYLTKSVPALVGLSVETFVRHVKTDNFSLFPASDAAYIGLREPLGWVNLGFVTGIQERVNIVEGAFPKNAKADDEVIEVAVSQVLAEEVGVQVGESYVMFKRAEVAPPIRTGNTTKAATPDKQVEEAKPTQFQVRVVGVWAAKDATDTFWFYNPKSLANTFMISEESFRTRVSPALTKEVYAAIWYLIFDGKKVRTDDVPGLLGRINYVNTRVSALLPNTVLDISPVAAMEKYSWTTFVMTIILYVFAIPILGLVLYFIGLISGLVVERQRGEIAILKSRGTGDFQVIGIYALEGLLVGAVGLSLGLLLGKQVAVIMGNTVSFLTFGSREQLEVLITPRVIRLALLGIAIALAASLMPAMRAAQLTIVTYKRDRARAMELPMWQRFFLDFLLLIPSYYGYYILRNRGTINFLGDTTGGNPFGDPLLFLVPALTIFAISLIMIRVFPWVMEVLAWLTGQLRRVLALVLALRQLARVSRQYTGSLLLLILTLSLATFTASMARTLDQSLLDRMYYRIGADYQLAEAGENPDSEAAAAGATTASTDAVEMSGWVFIPVAEHLKVPGITAATRVGSYPATATIGKTSVQGRFFGIDRTEFPNVGFFRQDFAYSTLGSLMNRLALSNNALLVSPNFLWDFSLNVGDRAQITVSAGGERKNVEFIIADLTRYFPTYYPDAKENQYLFVGNLEYLFEQMGGMFPYDVWIRTSKNVIPKEIEERLYDYDIRVVSMRGSREAIQAELERPERTGVFGILSVGFIAAAVLTMLGFLLHSFISFRRRFIEFGVLRAIGLSVGQMIGFLGVEQLMLILTGVTAGTGLGVWVSGLFIPFLQVGTAKNIDVPPFVVLIAWEDITKIYIVFAAMLLVAVAGMIWFLLRLKIFEAVKLGEAV